MIPHPACNKQRFLSSYCKTLTSLFHGTKVSLLFLLKDKPNRFCDCHRKWSLRCCAIHGTDTIYITWARFKMARKMCNSRQPFSRRCRNVRRKIRADENICKKEKGLIYEDENLFDHMCDMLTAQFYFCIIILQFWWCRRNRKFFATAKKKQWV